MYGMLYNTVKIRMCIMRFLLTTNGGYNNTHINNEQSYKIIVA